MKTRAFAVLPLFIVMTFVASDVSGDIFKFVDDNGKTHYTDDPSKLPGKYRPRNDNGSDNNAIIIEKKLEKHFDTRLEETEINKDENAVGVGATNEYNSAETASGIQSRSFTLPRHGTLFLAVPRSWRQHVRQPLGSLPPTIRFRPDMGDEFDVLITVLWSTSGDTGFNKPHNVKSLLENDRRSMLSTAVETNVAVQSFKGADGEGFYFLLTDKSPKPDGYPFAVRAGVGVGDLLLSATILSRDKNSAGIATTIKALKKAEQRYK